MKTEQLRDNWRDQQQQDERKLFYVALTRAKEYVYVYADVEAKEASPFLTEMNQFGYRNIPIP